MFQALMTTDSCVAANNHEKARCSLSPACYSKDLSDEP